LQKIRPLLHARLILGSLGRTPIDKSTGQPVNSSGLFFEWERLTLHITDFHVKGLGLHVQCLFPGKRKSICLEVHSDQAAFAVSDGDCVHQGSLSLMPLHTKLFDLFTPIRWGGWAAIGLEPMLSLRAHAHGVKTNESNLKRQARQRDQTCPHGFQKKL
jgi:hypothetical protein